jgi:hypothetical protein
VVRKSADRRKFSSTTCLGEEVMKVLSTIWLGKEIMKFSDSIDGKRGDLKGFLATMWL